LFELLIIPGTFEMSTQVRLLMAYSWSPKWYIKKLDVSVDEDGIWPEYVLVLMDVEELVEP
jgi:hypothetical protein